MGYTDTKNYKMKKPDASNKFDVMDLNNALDAVDTVMFTVDTDLNADLVANDAENKELIATNDAANKKLISDNDAENKELIAGIDARVNDATDKVDSLAYFNRLKLIKSYTEPGTYKLDGITPGYYFVHLMGGWGGNGGAGSTIIKSSVDKYDYNAGGGGGHGGSGYIYEGIVYLQPSDTLTIGENGVQGASGPIYDPYGSGGKKSEDGKSGTSGKNTVLTTSKKSYIAYGGSPGIGGEKAEYSGSASGGKGGNGYFAGDGGMIGFDSKEEQPYFAYAQGGRGFFAGTANSGFFGGTSTVGKPGNGLIGGSTEGYITGEGGDGLIPGFNVANNDKGFSSIRFGERTFDWTDVLTFDHPCYPIDVRFLLEVKKIHKLSGSAYILKPMIE